MRIAYLLNTYPVPSATFIRGEIGALTARGVDITRHAVRRFPGPLVEPADRAEQAQTRYLLTGNAGGLLAAFAREVLTNPLALVRTVPAWWRLYRNAGEGMVRHVAYIMEASLLRQQLAQDKIAHVHAHFSGNATTVAMLCRLLGGPAYSFTAHGPDEFVAPERHSVGMKIAHAAFVVAISDYARDLLAGLAEDPQDARRIIVARCGIDLDRFTPTPPVAVENQSFVCVGRLCPQKGQVHIPAAVAALKPRFPSVKVTLVGDGDSRAEIEAEIARHDVADAVTLLGWADNAEVRRRIGESRALLLPSYAEGLPMVIMEALALARPVLSTAITGIPELVDASSGWLVPPGDHAALVAAMTSALEASPEDLGRMGAAGRARVERQHAIGRLAETLEALFAASLRIEAAARPTKPAPAPARNRA